MSDEPSNLPDTDETLEGAEIAAEPERKCPVTAILVGVTLGVLAGTAIAIALRPPARRAALARSIQGSGERLAELLDTAASELRKPLDRTCALAADARSQAAKAIGRLAEGKKKRGCCLWS
jgi:hypothetical protein